MPPQSLRPQPLISIEPARPEHSFYIVFAGAQTEGVGFLEEAGGEGTRVGWRREVGEGC